MKKKFFIEASTILKVRFIDFFHEILEANWYLSLVFMNTGRIISLDSSV